MQVHLAVHDMFHRQAGRFDDALDVVERLAHLCFDCGRQLAVAIAGALARDVEEVAGHDSRTVRSDRFGAGGAITRFSVLAVAGVPA